MKRLAVEHGNTIIRAWCWKLKKVRPHWFAAKHSLVKRAVNEEEENPGLQNEKSFTTKWKYLITNYKVENPSLHIKWKYLINKIKILDYKVTNPWLQSDKSLITKWKILENKVENTWLQSELGVLGVGQPASEFISCLIFCPLRPLPELTETD